MSYFFDEIMAYHPDNRNVYDEIKQFLPKLVPFVGAGLTQFAYCSWPNALKELSNKLANSADKKRVLDLIDTKNYLDAAQILENLRTPNNLAHDIAQLFSADKLEQNRDKLHKEPVTLLPLLFPELVLTTNFDETLETIYAKSNHSFQRVFLPGHPGLLRQFILQGNTHGLFKLHGTLTGKLIEYEKIIFTRAQYNRHYKRFSSLTSELKSCFKHRMMLFLGCSLENDRTMELLQKVIRSGDTYYTIIDCEQSKRDEKIKQLGKKHIRAILYEAGRHEAVRVILEHLLEETNPTAYNALSIHVGALSSIVPTERFSYKAGIVPFVGRDQELKQLRSFLLDESISFLWWAILGPGGSGKSRLAYEFQQQLPPDWTARYLRAIDYENLPLLTEQLTQKTLLIADYVQENAKALGKWMEQLNEQKRSLPIRVLLVERNLAWTTQLYENVHYRQALEDSCYQKKFLSLDKMHDDHLMMIMRKYASALTAKGGYEKYCIINRELKLLLQKLKSVDPELCRPLYAMFLTDAYMAGQKPEQWNRNDILDYVIMREQDRLKFNLQKLFEMSLDENLYAACLYLQTMATVLQDASLETLQELCPEKWAIIQQKSDSFTSPASMLEKVDLSANGEIPALRPDLIGEYFVYTWMLKNQHETKQFLFAAWRIPKPTAVFFDRMFHDYYYLLNENPKHWELVLPKSIPSSENAALLYGICLVNAIYICTIIKECEQQAELLKKISLKFPNNSEIAILFAEGLINLIGKQNEFEARETIKQLIQLTTINPDTPDFTRLLAEGLLNLCNKQNEQEARKTVWHLESLTVANQESTEIAINFAKGLVNLCYKQDMLEIQDTVKRLETLASSYPDVPGIIICLAKSLTALGYKQDYSDAWDTAERLERLMHAHSHISKISVELALALLNLSFDHNVYKVKKSIEKLEMLVARNPHELKIVNALSLALFNLSGKQNADESQETTKKLEKVVKAYPNIPKFKTYLADSLANLISKQGEEKAIETLKHLEKLATDNPNITETLSMGLCNLLIKQDEKGREETVQRLECLTNAYRDSQEIADNFAMGLYHLCIDQDIEAAEATVKRLKHLAITYSNNAGIAGWLARGLEYLSTLQNEFDVYDNITYLEKLVAIHPDTQVIIVMLGQSLLNLSTEQDKHKIRNTIERLNSLTSTYPHIPELAVAFAQALVNLIHKQDKEEIPNSIRLLEQLAATYPDELYIIISLAQGLVVLSQIQDKKGILDCIIRLKQLKAMYPHVPDIGISLAQCLVELSSKQNEEEAQKTVNQLELLSDTWPNIQDIAIAFTHGLLNLSHKQDEQKARDTIRRLEDFIVKNPKWFR